MSTKTSFQLYPAIDVREGRVVRLEQGDYNCETTYGDNPLALAQAYAQQGAKWLHLVDLDAARVGGYTLGPLIEQIRGTTGLQIQTGGGVRSRRDVAAMLDAGASRVVIGSLSVRAAQEVVRWLGEFGPKQITIALDTRQDDAGVWQLPIHGWTEGSGLILDDLAVRYANEGLEHLLCTDISRDGMLTGPNFVLYRHLAELIPQVKVQASGGVHALSDVGEAQASGCGGIVLGRALLEGRFTLEQAFEESCAC